MWWNDISKNTVQIKKLGNRITESKNIDSNLPNIKGGVSENNNNIENVLKNTDNLEISENYKKVNPNIFDLQNTVDDKKDKLEIVRKTVNNIINYKINN